MKGAQNDTRPSASRRQYLKKQIPKPIVNEHYPLARYYALSQQLLEKFLDANEKMNLDDSYIWGMRYCYLVTDVIPSHGYYNSRKFSEEKQAARTMAKKVIAELQKIADVMDVEESVKQEELAKKLREQRKEKERLEKVRDALKVLRATTPPPYGVSF